MRSTLNLKPAIRVNDMKFRWLTFVLLVLILLFQVQLWIGEGSIGQQRQLKQQIQAQQDHNQQLEQRNQAIVLDIESLGDDVESDEGIEERARSELGMIKEDEVFFMIVEEGKE